MRHPTRLWSASLLAVLAITLLPGCIAYERNQSVVPDRVTLASEGIQVGSTPASWLSQTLGAPDSTQAVDGGEVWRYAIDTSRQTTVQALPLLRVAMASQQQTLFCFEVSDDIIIRQWQE